MKYNLKPAYRQVGKRDYPDKKRDKLQPVLTPIHFVTGQANRNCIRGPVIEFVRFCKAKSTKLLIGIDTAGTGRRTFALLGEVLESRKMRDKPRSQQRSY